MHFRVLLLTLFAIITTARGQSKDTSAFHILKTYWPVPPPSNEVDGVPAPPYTEYSWIACPTSQFDCSCFWGGRYNGNIQGEVGQPSFQLPGLCSTGQMTFKLDTEGNYQIWSDFDASHLGHCVAQNASLFTMGSGSQAISTTWTICNGMKSPNDVPNPLAEKTNLHLELYTTPPNFMDSISCDQPSCVPVQTGNLANYDWVSDYMACYSDAVCLSDWQDF